MLPASWPILRAQGVHVGRAHLYRQLNLLPHSRWISSSPRTHHSATVFLRQTHHFVDSFNDNENSRNAYPIDVFDDVDAIRRLVVLVQQGNVEDAGEVITDIVDFASASGNLDAFRQIKSILITPETSNIPLLSQFGFSLATRGYTDFVKDEIIPIVKQLGTPDQLSRVETSLAAAESAPPRRSTLAQTTVFEESSEDYQRIQDESIGPKPSITELIETQLPLLLPEPTADCSIFEEPAEDYVEHLSTNAQDHSASVSTGVLVDLVKTEQYTKAYRLLQEMRELGVVISPSAEFELAANAIFRRQALPSPEQIEEFFAWLTLIPPRNFSSSDPSFAQKWRAVINAPMTDGPFLRRFSLILASKGYARDAAILNFSTIIRHCDAETVQSFMEEFNVSYRNFCNRYPPVLPEDTPDYIFEWSRGIAVRALSYTNRLSEALGMLPDPKNPIFNLPIDAYDTILRSRQLGRRYRTYIPVIKELRDIAATISGDTRDIRKIDLQASFRAKVADPFDFGENLALGLRYLKKTVGSPTEIPHYSTLVNFMNGYLATGRTIALRMLIERAIRRGFPAARNFVFAEMLFYRRLKKYDLVIKAFADHFYLSGVSREAVLRRLDFIQRQNRQGRNIKRFYDFNDGRSLPVGKIWPLAEHCNLIWEALAKTTKNKDDLKRLYDQLVSFAQTGKDVATTRAIAAAEPLVPTVRRKFVGPAAFTPFLVPLMQARGAEFGATILHDMVASRLRPNRYHLSMLAGFYARTGHVEQAFSILDSLENKAKFQITGDNGTTKFKVPKYDMVIYTSMIRGFIISRRVEEAERLVQRLVKNYGYSEGKDQRLDAAIADLIDLKKLGDRWVS
ncbi:hypothetical protein M413DRAFT_63284 [Hebeloma cylindrosporum]|uniref:Pentacotripeptide-repeat region of PRORP domain-containing protein n=1 Tax=Hebeloma cylindrosporum TaxID=76867 RepID=A0A0C2Z0W8_HEBCY|nr:hypothetical protein M413DRAFT_63284 [Hebeloma cylindrosporum h7]